MWLLAAGALMFGLIPCGILCMHGRLVNRLIGLEGAATSMSLILMLLAEGSERAMLFDLALTLALLTFGGGLVFIRFLERWL